VIAPLQQVADPDALDHFQAEDQGSAFDGFALMDCFNGSALMDWRRSDGPERAVPQAATKILRQPTPARQRVSGLSRTHGGPEADRRARAKDPEKIRLPTAGPVV
jgi:hypothetical protein